MSINIPDYYIGLGPPADTRCETNAYPLEASKVLVNEYNF